MNPFRPVQILIEKNALQYPLTKKILKQFPRIPRRPIDSASSPPRGTSEKSLILAQHKGVSVFRCPGTPSYLCCNYFILDTGIGCRFDCSYCFLHQYRNSPGIVVYVNIEELLQQLTATIKKSTPAFKRIGTGEFTDSMMFDHITGHAGKLISYFADKDLVLELKTKSAQIDHILDIPHNKKTVLAWSLNPTPIIRTEEPAAASLEERLAAAARCQKHGYPVAFHFDPIIYHRRWKALYRSVIDAMKKALTQQNVAWISMGTLRFQPGLKPIMQRKFPKSDIIYAEMIKGSDGKLRYLQPVRIEIYRTMHRWLKEILPLTPVYLCMESPVVWQRSLGFCPKNPVELESHILSYWNTF